MAINTERWAQKKADVDRKLKERQEGNMWSKIEEGEYLCYIHKPVYQSDKHEHTAGFNFIEVAMHYGLGGKKNAQVCLDYKTNPILSHPLLQSFVANREKNAFKITPKLRCEACDGLESGDITDTKNKQQLKWFIGLTPMWYRKEKKDKWTRMKFKPRFLIAGSQIFNGYMNSLIDLANDGIDPMDPDAAVLMKLTRTGTEFNTEYNVVTDIGSARKPVQLDKAQKAILAKAVKPKGDLDLFAIVASFTKSPNQIASLISGIESSGEEEEAEMKRECFGQSWTDDDECRECNDSDECMRVCGIKPKEVAARSGKQSSKPTGGKQPSKPSKREPVEEPEPEEQLFESQMECFGNYCDEDEACRCCDEAEQCCAETSDEAVPVEEEIEELQEEEVEESEEVEDGVIAEDLPNCYQQYDGDDEGCAQCDVKEQCEADSVVDDSGTQAEPDEPEDDEDPDIKKLEEEAKRLASKSRGRGKK